MREKRYELSCAKCGHVAAFAKKYECVASFGDILLAHPQSEGHGLVLNDGMAHRGQKADTWEWRPGAPYGVPAFYPLSGRGLI